MKKYLVLATLIASSNLFAYGGVYGDNYYREAAPETHNEVEIQKEPINEEFNRMFANFIEHCKSPLARATIVPRSMDVRFKEINKYQLSNGHEGYEFNLDVRLDSLTYYGSDINRHDVVKEYGKIKMEGNFQQENGTVTCTFEPYL